MIKYQLTKVTFAEVPDEISLCIEIANCKNRCPGCHSPWLQKDEGKELTAEEVKKLVDQNPGITCICFMGGDPEEMFKLAKEVRKIVRLKLAWYTGLTLDDLDHNYPNASLAVFNYIKVGPYIEAKGPLNKRTTNQRMYLVDINDCRIERFEDITGKFWPSNEDFNGELGDIEGD